MTINLFISRLKCGLLWEIQSLVDLLNFWPCFNAMLSLNSIHLYRAEHFYWVWFHLDSHIMFVPSPKRCLLVSNKLGENILSSLKDMGWGKYKIWGIVFQKNFAILVLCPISIWINWKTLTELLSKRTNKDIRDIS